MKQKLNKKLVKQLRKGYITYFSSNRGDKCINILKAAFKERFNENCINGDVFYYKKEDKEHYTASTQQPTGLEVYYTKDFFKPAKVKLKDVDKPIWFPDAETGKKYEKQLSKQYTVVVFDKACRDNYIGYKDIKWPKTKPNIEDRVTDLESNLKTIDYLVRESGLFEKGGITYESSAKTEITIPESILKQKEVYINGVKQEPKEEPIDWSKPQFFQSKTGVIVLCDGTEIGNKFGGTVVKGYMVIELGQYRNTWRKNDFKPFKGTITV